jgi:hypothetical protein
VKHSPLLAAFVFTGAVLAFGSFALSTDDVSPSIAPGTVYTDGEDLVYEVSWTIFKIGTIHLKTLGDFKAIAYIDSYAGLPFVDLHSIHYTEMDSTFHTRSGYAIDKDGKEWKGLRYIPDLSGKRVAVEKLFYKDPASQPYKREPRDTIQLKSISFVDGLAIGHFPRLFIHSVQTVNVQTILKGNSDITTFFFTNKKTTVDIGALDYPIRVVEVEGSTNAVGVYGMTGDFTGWFSDDAAAVPIKGKLKVLLGNVTAELIQWNRKGWKPPQ